MNHPGTKGKPCVYYIEQSQLGKGNEKKASHWSTHKKYLKDHRTTPNLYSSYVYVVNVQEPKQIEWKNGEQMVNQGKTLASNQWSKLTTTDQ